METRTSFSLSWNQHSKNLLESFRRLYESAKLFDIFFKCGGEEELIGAHSTIVYINSGFVRNHLETNGVLPIIELTGVSAEHFRLLLGYMYTGALIVDINELTLILELAKKLQISGLISEKADKYSNSIQIPESTISDLTINTKNEEVTMESESDLDSQLSSPTATQEVLEIADTESDYEQILTDEFGSSDEGKHQVAAHTIETKIMRRSSTDQLDTSEVGDYKVMSLECKAIGEDSNSKLSGVKCQLCHRVFANRYNLKVHVRDKHDTKEGTFQCNICQKPMRNPSCLRVHMYHHRKQAAVSGQQGGTQIGDDVQS